MRITLFTSNNIRHNYLINLLSTSCSELFVIQECKTIFPGTKPGRYPLSKIVNSYFENVNRAQIKIFGHSYSYSSNKNLKILPLAFDDLNNCSLNFLSPFLKSDLYIVYGSSYIKGELLEFLVENKTINIHMGVSPYYRGTDCNFWALYDGNPHLVGATIHLLSKGIDSGKILYHAMSNVKTSPYEYTMSTVKSAFHSVSDRIKDKSLLKIQTSKQDRDKEIRYSKKVEFDEKVLKDYLKKNIDLNSKNFDTALLKEPYFLKDE
tara:strand:- start:25 stop:816 length:792 start_codon:yes stop_codon:yes gene_type:complete